MKRAVRWIGIGVTAAAAATMLLADMALAGPASISRVGATGTRDQFVLRFDLLSPGGFSCAADAPGSQVRSGRDLLGRPMIRVFGDARAAVITCTDAEGTRWQATANRTAPYTPAEPTYGTVVYRPGQPAMMTIVELGDQTEYQHKTFVRVD